MWLRKLGFAICLCAGLGACAPVEPRQGAGMPGGPLIQVQALDSILKAAAPLTCVIDVRPEEEYLAGHIPGALNVWRPALADKSYPYGSISAPKPDLEALFGKMGVREDLPIVLYDGKMNADAANLWWLFRVGGKQDVQLLDGGLAAWQAAGLALEADPVKLPPTSFHFPKQGDSSRYASLNTVRMALNDPQTILLDTRTYDEYTGRMVKQGAKRGGRIPGSVWIDYAAAMTERDGCQYLKPLGELETLFQGKGVGRDKKIICYCHSGVRSAHTTFVLTQLLGYPHVRNFDGSWEEWSQQDSLPIDTGAVTEAIAIQ